MPYRLTKRAADDLRGIYNWGKRHFGQAHAVLYHHSLEELFELLADNPEVARERQEITPPVRVHPFGAHMIIYKVEHDGSVLIVRISHNRENWVSLIPSSTAR
ncbi:type II toxin-antitoxin system RelE/ParE family toxin [Pararhizobium sp.]|uniref:type II toxin-antitoxin system RelE/ParE family toxin n=1 Tax=Pararhizobium sp. TaxID=1977563 RepID=UPI00271CEA48|nr:type II toxin-antitoxin system RelE/ParE family toxin [Pararhizobium sp.]MDO9418624.1 type II toxin-antitoxin system RelE/ParE family toxin [Pararhizobium sp.]